jgi:hypothetical protein
MFRSLIGFMLRVPPFRPVPQVPLKVIEGIVGIANTQTPNALQFLLYPV